ncbi:unnamed protein product, partial [Scytosiphon promiscuus]
VSGGGGGSVVSDTDEEDADDVVEVHAGGSGGGGGGGGSNRSSGRFRSDRGGDERTNALFRNVVQELDNIAEDEESSSSCNASTRGDVDGILGDGQAQQQQQQQQQQAQQPQQTNGASIGMGGTGATAEMARALLARAFSRTSGGGATVRGSRRGFPSRSGSVRFSRRTSGGSKGFYRDPGQVGEDHWRSLGASGPDLTPRELPAEWRNSNASGASRDNEAASPPVDPKAPALGLVGGTLFSTTSSERDQSRHRRNKSNESAASMATDAASMAEGAAATAAASALLYGSSRRAMTSGWSSRSVGDLSRLSSFTTRGNALSTGGRGSAPRLQLSEHGVIPLLEASVTGNGELEELVNDLRKTSRDEHVRALIRYVCSPALNSDGSGGGTNGGAGGAGSIGNAAAGGSAGAGGSGHFQPSSASSPSAGEAGPAEIALKRFGLQIIRAVIATAPPAGDGAEGLPGMWQAGGGADGDGGVSTNAGRRGREVDEEARRLDRERAGRQQQQERIAGLGGGSTILLFVGGLRTSSTRDTAADAFLLAVEMLKGGNKRVQEHFFAVLRDSRQDERFFEAVTNFAEQRVRQMAAADSVSEPSFSGHQGGSGRVGQQDRQDPAQARWKQQHHHGWWKAERPQRPPRRARGGSFDGDAGSGRIGRIGSRASLPSSHGSSVAPSVSSHELDLSGAASRPAPRPGMLRRFFSRTFFELNPELRVRFAAFRLESKTAPRSPWEERRPRAGIFFGLGKQASQARDVYGAGRERSMSFVVEARSSPQQHLGDSYGAPFVFPFRLFPTCCPSQRLKQTEQDEVSSLSALMEFLRLLCENHYLEMQDYMRTQPDNMRSYNLVTEVCTLLQGLEWVVLDDVRYWGIDSTNIGLAYTVVRTLVEFAQGNEENKMAIATPSLSASINDLFWERFDGLGGHSGGTAETSPAGLKHQGFVLLYSLIEGCHEPSVFSTLLHTLDFEAILGVLQDARETYALASRDYRTKERRYFKLRRAKWRAILVLKRWRRKLAAATEEFKASEERWRAARRGYSTPVLFLRALLDGGRVDNPEICAVEETRQAISSRSEARSRFKFFLTEWEGSLRSIEIKRGGRLEKMYFVVPDWCRVHWKKTPVAEMRELMKRRCAKATSSPGWKLLRFYQQGEGMLSQMAYLHTLQATSLHVITVHEVKWSVLTFVLALTINVCDIVGSSQEQREEGGTRLGNRVYTAGTAIGVGHLVISCLRLVAFMYNRQQKWLFERRLPDLTFLRGLLRLDPEGAGHTRRGAKKNTPSTEVPIASSIPMVMSQSQSYRGLAEVGGPASVAAGPAANIGASSSQAEPRGGRVDLGGTPTGGGGAGRLDEGVDMTNSIGSAHSAGRRRAALKQGVQGGVATLTRLAKEISYESYQDSSRGSFTMSAFSSNRSSTDSEDSEEEQMRAGRGGGGAG